MSDIYFHCSWNQNRNKKIKKSPKKTKNHENLQQGDKYKQTSKKKRIFNRQPAAPPH
jgi:hypothetical protein